MVLLQNQHLQNNIITKTKLSSNSKWYIPSISLKTHAYLSASKQFPMVFPGPLVSAPPRCAEIRRQGFSDPGRLSSLSQTHTKPQEIRAMEDYCARNRKYQAHQAAKTRLWATSTNKYQANKLFWKEVDKSQNVSGTSTSKKNPPTQHIRYIHHPRQTRQNYASIDPKQQESMFPRTSCAIPYSLFENQSRNQSRNQQKARKHDRTDSFLRKTRSKQEERQAPEQEPEPARSWKS